MQITASLDEIIHVVKVLEELIDEDAIVILRGDLASGKTTLVKAYVRAQGIDHSVTSPTFLLQNIYGDRIYHYDLYRIDEEEFERLGLIEEFDKSGVHFVEWGSEALEAFFKKVGYHVITVTITPEGSKRRYRILSDAHP